jgi:putative tryptophan/tyrosine transport system substrate-binding protein
MEAPLLNRSPLRIPTAFLACSLFCVALTSVAGLAQEAPKVGVLFPGPKGSAAIAAFVKGMESLGYHDGKTIIYEFRYAGGKTDQLQLLATELVEQKPKLIVGVASEAVVAAAKATRTIPIVSATGDVDFIGLGLAKSLERPGGNVTGMTVSAGEAAQRRVELLKQTVPSLSTVAVLMHPSWTANPRLLSMMEQAAKPLGIALRPISISKPEDLDGVIAAAKANGANAISSLQGPFFFFQRKLLAELCQKHKIALAMSEPLSAEAGALLQVNPDVPGAAAVSAKFVDQIIKGAQPADLPIERHATIEVILNMKIARALGISIDPVLISRVRTIE